MVDKANQIFSEDIVKKNWAFLAHLSATTIWEVVRLAPAHTIITAGSGIVKATAVRQKDRTVKRTGPLSLFPCWCPPLQRSVLCLSILPLRLQVPKRKCLLLQGFLFFDFTGIIPIYFPIYFPINEASTGH